MESLGSPEEIHPGLGAEWLEADGLGGFASGTVGGVRTRRYHALLLAATTPPTGRIVFVNGFDAWVKTAVCEGSISSQHYSADVIQPAGLRRIESFEYRPWPRWVFRLEDDTRIEQEILAIRGTPAVLVCWRLLSSGVQATLTVRPFLSGRDYHACHHENSSFCFDAAHSGTKITWNPYPSHPAILSYSNMLYRHEPTWYRGFVLETERARGLDFTEDLASPGTFTWDLSKGEAYWLLSAGYEFYGLDKSVEKFESGASELQESERDRRAAFASPLELSADAYITARGEGMTIIAGYPWFTDWGRDTFIALRGLCIATGRLDDASSILHQWAEYVSDGMLPNRFPDHNEEPEYNSVDASLWFIVAVHDYLVARMKESPQIRALHSGTLGSAVESILSGFSEGTRFGIRADPDGLLRSGGPGVALTWMDALIDGWPVTPRIGKPVEVQALWINALRIGARFSAKWEDLWTQAEHSFEKRFWSDSGGCLFDNIDADHLAGRRDASFRANQILAIGGLPFSVIEGARARRVVDTVERRLWTPMGLRSLAVGEAGYQPRYGGGVRERDMAYHQGTVWPWLAGPFIEAWVRVRGGGPEIKAEAREKFLKPLMDQLGSAGLGHLSEIADADPPHLPKGCPFQAWSLGELIRLDRVVLAD